MNKNRSIALAAILGVLAATSSTSHYPVLTAPTSRRGGGKTQEDIDRLDAAQNKRARKVAKRAKQGGYIDINFGVAFAALLVIGAAVGALLFHVLPKVWEWVKPFLHQLTA